MKLILHGELKKRFGSSVEFNSPNVADALEGFSRQCEDFPTNMIIEAVGFETEEKLFAPTDVKEVHLIPAMHGGGGIGKILLGAALIALVVFAPQIGLQLSAQLGGALLGAGIGLAIGGIMQLFMKAPTISKSEDPAASKYLSSGKNTTAFGTPITMAWGRVKLFPHWLSIQVNSNNMVYGTFPASPT